jgi:hypothetical protein
MKIILQDNFEFCFFYLEGSSFVSCPTFRILRRTFLIVLCPAIKIPGQYVKSGSKRVLLHTSKFIITD